MAGKNFGMSQCVCAAVLVWLVMWSGLARAQQSRIFVQQWQQVAALRKAADKGSEAQVRARQMAADRLIAQIRRQALAQNQPLEYLRAEEATPARIDQLEDELPRLTFPARPVVHSLLGDAYVRYLNDKHYKQALSAWGYRKGGNRADAWSDGQVASAAIRHYRASVLEDPARQLRVSLRTVPGVRLGGTPEARAAQPTLFDLLTHRAAAGLRQMPGYGCTLPDNLLAAAAHDSLTAFARRTLPPPATDSTAGICQVLWLWQHYGRALLVGPASPAQRATAELERMLLARPLLTSAQADSLAIAALLRGARQYAALPVAADFLVAAARATLAQPSHMPAGEMSGQGGAGPLDWRKRAALAYCREAERRFPRSAGGRQAAVLRQVLTGQPSLSLKVPPTQLPQQPWQLSVNSVRVPVVSFSAYRMPLSEAGASSYEVFQLTNWQAQWLPAQTPVAKWQQALTLCPDSACQTTQSVGCPALPPGHYLIVAQPALPAAARSNPEPLVHYAEVEMSGLVMLKRSSLDALSSEWRLLDRRSGRVPVQAQWRPLYEAALIPDKPRVLHWGPALRYDTLGWLRQLPARRLGTPDSAQLVGLLACQAGDSLLLRLRADEILHRQPATGSSAPEVPVAAAGAVVTFATDRPEYQPGQTLHYQGLLTDASLATPGRPLAGWADTLTITDGNWQVLARRPVLSSADGTFAGQITLPDTVLQNNMLGLRMTRAVDTRWRAQPWLRPSARPLVLALSGPAPQLVAGQQVQLRGQVPGPARLGEPRQVHYQIKRQLLQVDTVVTGEAGQWTGNEPEIIRAGLVEAAPDGTFTVAFRPDAPPASSAGGGAMGYRYQVLVATEKAVGAYTGTVQLPLHYLVLRGPSQVNQAAPAPFTLQTANPLQWDQFSPTEGWLRLFRLQPPPDTLAQLPPNALLQAKWQRWSRTLVAAWPFDTRNGAAVQLPMLADKLPPGAYVLVASTTGNRPAASQHSFVLSDGPAMRWLHSPSASSSTWTAPIPPGDTLTVNLDSGAPAGPVLIEASIGDSLVARQWLPVRGGRPTRWQLPLARAWRGRQVKILATQFHHNILYSSEIAVPVLALPAPLTLQMKRGGRVEVHNQAGQPVAAQVTAITQAASYSSGAEDEDSLLPLPWPSLPPSARLAVWELPGKFMYSSGSTWERELYWPMALPPSLGRRNFEMGMEPEDSVEVKRLHGLVPKAATDAASTVPQAIEELFRAVQRSYALQPDSTYWQPALATSTHNPPRLRLPARTDPGRRLLVRAHTRQGEIGKIDQWLALAAPLGVQVRAWPLAADGRQWLVTAGVRNDGLTVQQGQVRLALPTGGLKYTDTEPATQAYRLLPGQQAVLSWHLTTPDALSAFPVELKRKRPTQPNFQIICLAP
jgi:hypothetical protein